tara:strand:+ start:9292 stop:10083 length:792 start_codon:yes stop_codon:yes gene_type:complete
MSAKGGCFIGASLSCVDILVYLYFDYLNIDKSNLTSHSRDLFLLSKGHDVPALYSVLSEKEILEKERLNDHCSVNDDIYWHPNVNIPGIEFHSGSLGHGLSVAIGFAYYQKIRKLKTKTVVMIGDGEMNEGSIWEGLLVASAKKLDNLIIVIDRNEFQANLKTEDLIPLEPIDDKIKSFGCNSVRINGHKFSEIENGFKTLENEGQKPSVLIADTVRGKGLPSIERDPTRWFVHFSEKEVEMLLGELRGEKIANLTSEKLLVR